MHTLRGFLILEPKSLEEIGRPAKTLQRGRRFFFFFSFS